MAIAFTTSFFMVGTVQSQDNLSPIQYQVLGDKKRADAVASYMTRKGYAVTPVVEPGVYGQLHGKKWPGVRWARLGADKKEGVFIPVSDNALSNGLCSDQQDLLDGMMKYERPGKGPEVSASIPVPEPPQDPCLPASTATIPEGCACGDFPWPATGIWADFPANGVEIQNKPLEHVYKIKWVVRDGNTIRAICCFKSSKLPDFREMEMAWGNGRRLTLWKDFGGCDGGQNCTLQILLFQ